MRTYLVHFTIGSRFDDGVDNRPIYEETVAESGAQAAENVRQKNNRYLAGVDILNVYERTYCAADWQTKPMVTETFTNNKGWN